MYSVLEMVSLSNIILIIYLRIHLGLGVVAHTCIPAVQGHG
jgi:hypothetical protein